MSRKDRLPKIPKHLLRESYLWPYLEHLELMRKRNPLRKAPAAEAYGRFLKNYMNFEDRASRAEYWWCVVYHFLISFIFLFFFGVEFLREGILNVSLVLFILYSVGTFIPWISLTVRRLHDSNRSGWLILIGLFPCVGGLVIFILTLLEGTEGPNKYGEPSDF